MGLFSSQTQKSAVGLDIEAGSIAATEVRANGSVEVVGHGVAPLPPGIFREGEVADPDTLGAVIKELFAAQKLSKNVRLGIANQRVAVRMMRLPAIEDPQELETAVRFQAQDHIPMPLEQSVFDWQLIGHSQDENGQRRVDVVAVAARRDMLQQMMRALDVAGLRPIGIDHSAFGMIRALAGANGAPVGAGEFVSAPASEQETQTLDPDAAGHVPARLYCYLGDVTNLAVARGTACLFTRIASFGVEGIAQKLAERRELTLEHSRQWLSHVGLSQALEEVEGAAEHVAAARDCLVEGAAKLADELRLSLDYYGAQEGAVAVEQIVACGPGATIPGLVDALQRTLGHRFTVSHPDKLGSVGRDAAARLTLSYGLALDE